jgi:hypothetical protein
MKENDDLYHGCVMLEPREWLDNAIKGKCAVTGGVIYDKEEVIQIFMHKDNLEYFDARDMVEYNTERSLPYMPDPKPILMDSTPDYEEDEEDE